MASEQYPPRIDVSPGASPAPRRKGWTCCIGCLIAFVILAILAVVGSVIGLFYFASSTILSDEPIEVAQVEYTQQESDQVMQRWAEIQKQRLEGDASFDLNERELQILLTELIKQQQQTGGESSFGLSADLEGEKTNLAGWFKLSGKLVGGKYINIGFSGTVKIENGQIFGKADSITFGNLPPQSAGSADAQLNTQLRQNPDVKEILDQIKLFEVRDGVAHIELFKREPTKDELKAATPAAPEV